MASERTIQAAKKLRKALQIALSAVELDDEDVAELGEAIFDPFDSDMKYKKGEICMSGGKAYICLKTTKQGLDPSADPEHWSVFGDVTDPGQGGTDSPEPSGDATYNKGDSCVYGGRPYTCLKNNVQGITPGTDDKYWAAD